MFRFSEWLKTKNEWANFGFDKPKVIRDIDRDENPTNPLNVEYVINSLKRNRLGYSEHFGELQWGEEPGAIKVVFSPLGGLRLNIRKLTTNLKGETVWIGKRTIEVKNLYDTHPDTLIAKIHENLDKIGREGIENPLREYQDLEKFTITLASTLKRRNTQVIFMYEGIRKVRPHEEYIIHFGVTGMGVQARGQRRVDQFAINTKYEKNSGMIKIVGTEVGDRIVSHRWQLEPSSFIEYFSPNQDTDEIINVILGHFNSY